MDAIPKKPSPRKAIPEKEAEVENEPLSLRELSGYADTFYTSFNLRKLYEEFTKEGRKLILPDGSNHKICYVDFVKVVHTYIKITREGRLEEAIEAVDDFLDEKRAELAINFHKNELVNVILFQAHNLGRDKNYEKLSIEELEKIVKILTPTPNTSDPQMINGQINPANCTKLIFNSEDWIVGVIE